jgi:serine protease AprX
MALTGQPAAAQHSDEIVRRAAVDGRSLPVIVRYKDAAALTRGRGMLAGRGAIVRRQHRGVQGVGLTASGATLRALLESGDVEGVSYDSPMRALQVAGAPAMPVSIDSSGAAAARERYHVDGGGVRVAVLDSGVQPHADLPAARIAAFVDFVNGRATPYDDYGHGTHVAGLIAGAGTASTGRYTGAAPGAEIVALKVLDAEGAGSTSTVLAALDWVEDNAAAYRIRVVNLSIGHPVHEAAADDPLVAMVERLSRKGIVVVVSAGNMGFDTAAGQAVYQSITSPGNAPSAITVGAAHTHGSDARSDDTVAPFSSHGPTAFDQLAKPDLVAPGQAVVSLAAGGSTLLSSYPQFEVEPGYFRLNGTSMAAPVVAGAAALMLDGNPGLSAHTVKAVLQFTAQQLPAIDALTQGAGSLNVAGAVRLAQLIDPDRRLNRYWLRLPEPPNPFDELFGEQAAWSRQVFWGDRAVTGDSAYVRLRAWEDNRAWSQNIVWATGSNIVWATDVRAQNIVWATSRNIVWATAGNIVWATARNIVWATANNIVWATRLTGQNIVWATGSNIVWATDTLVRGTSDAWGLQPAVVSGFDTAVGLGPSLTSGQNIVWATGSNIVWATGSNIVWATGSNIVWATTSSHDVLTWEG